MVRRVPAGLRAPCALATAHDAPGTRDCAHPGVLHRVLAIVAAPCRAAGDARGCRTPSRPCRTGTDRRCRMALIGTLAPAPAARPAQSMVPGGGLLPAPNHPRALGPRSSSAASMKPVSASSNLATEDVIEAQDAIAIKRHQQEKSRGFGSAINLGVNPQIQARECAPRLGENRQATAQSLSSIQGADRTRPP